MKTIFHDKESGTKLEMEGTFANSKAQLVDDEGNVVIESEGSYYEVLGMISKLSGEEDEQKNIRPDELFVVNNDEMEYYLEFEKGEVIRFLSYEEDDFSLIFENSKGVEQLVEYEDVTRLGNQEGSKLKFDFCYENDILLTGDTSLEGTKVNLTEPSIWIEDDESLIIHTDCDDGIPYIVSSKSGEGAFVSLENLEKREFDTLQDTPSFEIGETVEVKKRRAHSGAVGYAILVDIKEDEIILQGFNKHGEFLDSWHNNIENIKKVK